jgi:hypothetical protein
LRGKIRLSTLAVAVSALLAMPAVNASAATTNPGSLDFGSQPVGSTSPAKSTTLTTACVNVTVTCLSLPTDTMNVSVGTTGPFAATSDCPASLAPTLLGEPASCTINVRFTPTSAGPKTGTLSTGTVGLLAPTPGPTVALSGKGASSGNVANACKSKKGKKKKKRSASTAKKHKKQKKCKKHKKKKHRG